AFLQQAVVALLAQLVAQRGGAAVLPDQRMRQRAAAGAVPDKGGLALVGDADGGHVGGRGAGVAQRLAGDVELALPDLAGVVLDPARLRIVLTEFALAHAARMAVAVEHNGARTGGALVQRQDERSRHGTSLPTTPAIGRRRSAPASGTTGGRPRTGRRSPGTPPSRRRWRHAA